MSDLWLVRTMHDEPGKCIASSVSLGLDIPGNCPNKGTRFVLARGFTVALLCQSHAEQVSKWPGYSLGDEVAS